MSDVTEHLLARLEARGLRGRVVSIERVGDLRRDIEDRHAGQAFDGEFYKERLSAFDFNPPHEPFVPESIIVAAMPRPQTRVDFAHRGRSLSLVLPPTYLQYDAISRRIESALEELLLPHGYGAVLAKLPLKTLAVRSGLGAYGRNNICYVPGMGSFLQLAACYSDLPCAKDEWREPAVMEACENCSACVRKCPTQAIAADRFLLHAERCIVFHNEKPAGRPLPEWLDLSSHDCLIGCMHCQRYCPVDKKFLGWFDGNEVFSDAETSLLLEGCPYERLPAETASKLDRLERLDDLEIVTRNLRILCLHDFGDTPRCR